jgi:glycosyltransferase involved in cell wall biosynthesis
LIHLHWISGGFLRIESLSKIKLPLAWTLHDSWAFTGGCHIPFECNHYQKDCGYCPTLQSETQRDLSARILARKTKFWKNMDITLVTPSRWLADCAKSSSVFHNKTIQVIPHGLDLDRFKPVDKQFARSVLSLSPLKKLILFGAQHVTRDKNKGEQQFKEALQILSYKRSCDNIEVIIFGASEPPESQDLGFPVHYMGYLWDDISIALLYGACDVMVVPSRQEAFGQTASEAMACGCPVVAFGTSGLLDIIDHKKNGYLAAPFDSTDLASGISWVLGDSQRQKQLAQEARGKAIREFDVQIMAKRYLKLYEGILG